MLKKGDEIIIIGGEDGEYHWFSKGDICTVQRIIRSGCIAMRSDTLKQGLLHKHFTKSTNYMKQMKAAALKVAKDLLKANNTVTTLEIKTQLRKAYPAYRWFQNTRKGVTGVSEIMDSFAQKGTFVYKDNGTFRVYSDPTQPKRKAKVTGTPAVKKVVKTITKKIVVPVAKPAHVAARGIKKTISRTKALDLMTNNKGHFFTATFTKKDGSIRTINCQYMKDQSMSQLGYVKVKESGKCKNTPNDCIRNINLQTLTDLKIAGNTYKVK